jgi:hypothetical protein|tara:strand:- start:2682 stop:3506 length:825 start_codon:yes stop_codon:yes gene_type:complete
MKICFIADFFADEVNGGGELSNEELINILSTKHDVSKIKSIHFLPEHVEDDVNYVVCNFIGLREDSKSLLKNYIIYEHDHKYLDNRNPAVYNNFIAPKENIVNYDFYKNAKSVICQSTMHKEIVEKNLKLDNIISIGGNLWSEDVLDLLENYSKNPKSKKYSIMNSHIDHKNTIDAVRFCKYKKYDYELIDPCPYDEFLLRLGQNEGFVFFPKTPETLSRIIVESRMMDMKVITNKLPGAVREPWFEKRGVELIDIMRNKRQEISDTVINIFEE